MRLFDPGAEVRHPTPKQARRRAKSLRSRVTVGEVIDLYLRHQQVTGGFEPRTHAQAVSMLSGFVKLHGARPISELFPFHVTDWIEGNKRWKTSGTRARVAAAVNAALNWAEGQGRIIRNPVKAVRYSPSDPREAMPDDVFERYCHAAPKPLERIMRFLRLVGCREGEALRSKWEDYDLDKAIWTVGKHKTWKKTKKPKIKVLVPAAVALLRQIGPKPFGSVFHSCKGKPWSDSGSLGRAFLNVKKRLGLEADPYTLHSIRHRFVTAAVAAGAPVPAIAAQVGHDCLATTMRYVHMSQEMESVRAAAILAQPKP